MNKKLTTPKNVFAIGISQSGSLSGYEVWKINNIKSNIISSKFSGGGWCVELGATSSWVDIQMPFGVVIGDSIAEGHPALHGRLHPNGVATFDQNYKSSEGQLNYEISRLTNAHWFNHGIGSETTANILSRFDRDVLGRTVNVGDGRGEKTLNGLPYAALVVAGANDIWQNVPVEAIKSNFVEMLNKLIASNIIPIFTTIGNSTTYTPSQKVNAELVNEWIKKDFADMGAHVFDLWGWDIDENGIKQDIYADELHPNKAGYALIASEILKSLPIELTLTSFMIQSKVDPSNKPSNWISPKDITVSKDGFPIMGVVSDDWIIFNASSFPSSQSPNVRLSIDNPKVGVSGFNAISCYFSRYGLPNTEPVIGSSSGIPVHGVIQKDSAGKWKIPTDFIQKGLISISADSTKLTVTCAPCGLIFTSNVGSAPVKNNIKISASWGVAPVTTFDLSFGNGSSALNPMTTSVPNSTYYAVIGL